MAAMGKTKKMMKLPFLSKNDAVLASWPWSSCQQPRTLCFRADDHDETTSKPSTESVSDDDAADPIDEETVIKGLRSERLFFEPGDTKTSSIMEEAKLTTGEEEEEGLRFKESIVLSMESRDPYNDFRESMEEMVEADPGLKKDWEGLEELLFWYLKSNEKANHGYIVGAFVDLLVKLAVSSSTTTDTNNNNNCIPSCSNPSSRSPSSPLSFYSSSSSSPSSCSSSEDNSSTTKEIINEEDNRDDVSSS